MMNRKDMNQIIGNRVRQIRDTHQYTREQVAEWADISPQFLSDIELGKKSMTSTTIVKLAKALQISTDYLLLGKSNLAKEPARTRKLQILASSLPDEKIPIAEDMMRVFLRAVDVKRTSPDTKKQKTDSPKSRNSQK